jgi:hypothetical protein
VRKKSAAQLYLERVEMIDSIIKNKLIEQRQWKDIALGITANMGGERVQSSGSQSKMADAIEKCVDMETEIDRLVDKLIETKKEVIQTIEQLDNPTLYNILHKRHIQFKALWQIAEDYDREYGWVTTNYGRAIAEVQRILDEKKFVSSCE